MLVEYAIIGVLIVIVVIVGLALAGPALTQSLEILGDELNNAADRSATYGANVPTLTDHALLHSDAQEAFDYLNAIDVSGCKWDCNDGRTRYNCEKDPGQWAFAVVEAGRTITAFFTSQEYGVGATKDNPIGCSNPYHPAHP